MSRTRRGGIWRHRRWTMPLAAAGSVYVAGAIVAVPAVGLGWTLLLTIPLLLAEVALVTRFVTDPVSRGYAHTMSVCITVWLIIASLTTPWTGFSFWSWFAGGLLFGVAWATNRRLEQRIQIEGVVEAWPGVAQRLGLGDAVMPKGGFRARPDGWEAVVEGVDSEQLQGALRNIAVRLRLRKGRLRVEETPDAHISRLVYEESDRLTQPVKFDPSKLIGSITDAIHAGTDHDGKPVLLQLWKPGSGARHMLVAGMTRSGKSSFLNMIIANVAHARDAMLWLVDLKGGQEFGMWTRVAKWLGIEKPTAVQQVAAIHRIVEGRGKLSRKLGMGKTWQPSEEHPVIVFVIDEVAELTGDAELQRAIAELKSIMRRAASVGIIMIFATQYPTIEALGSSQVRTQFTIRVCFRTQKKGDARVILNNAEAVNTARITEDMQGTAYIEVADYMPLRFRSGYVEEEVAEKLDRLLAPRQPDLDPGTLELAGEPYWGRDLDPLEILDDGDASPFDGDGDGDGSDQAFPVDGESDGDTSPSHGEGGDSWSPLIGDVSSPASPVPSPSSGDGDAGGYWSTLIVRGDEEMSDDRPSGLGADFSPADVWSDEFPKVNDVRLSTLPKAERPAVERLDPDAARAAFERCLIDATRAGRTVSPRELGEASTLSRATVHRWLEEYLEAATVARVDTGAYRWAGKMPAASAT